MKLFRHSSGIILSFGFDMWKRRPDSQRVFFSDVTGSHWKPGERLADFLTFEFDIAPEFTHETGDGVIVAYQPGKCITITPDVSPFVFKAKVLRPEPQYDDWKPRGFYDI